MKTRIVEQWLRVLTNYCNEFLLVVVTAINLFLNRKASILDAYNF